MRTLAAGLTTLTLLAVVPSLARAQANPVELGIDAALAVSLDDPRVTIIGIPLQQFRVGFFTSPILSFEPTLSVNYIDVEGVGDLSTLSLGLGVLVHLSPDRTRTRAYVRPFAGFARISADGESETDANMGFGVGLKTPFANQRLATRLEAFLNHVFAEPDGVTSLGVSFGLSFFTR
jgi:hypothetical protein